MQETKKFKFCYLLEISGQNDHNLEVYLDQFLNESLVDLLYNIRNSNEEMIVHVGKVNCTDLEGKPHTCLTKIKLRKIDNNQNKKYT